MKKTSKCLLLALSFLGSIHASALSSFAIGNVPPYGVTAVIDDSQFDPSSLDKWHRYVLDDYDYDYVPDTVVDEKQDSKPVAGEVDQIDSNAEPESEQKNVENEIPPALLFSSPKTDDSAINGSINDSAKDDATSKSDEENDTKLDDVLLKTVPVSAKPEETQVAKAKETVAEVETTEIEEVSDKVENFGEEVTPLADKDVSIPVDKKIKNSLEEKEFENPVPVEVNTVSDSVTEKVEGSSEKEEVTTSIENREVSTPFNEKIETSIKDEEIKDSVPVEVKNISAPVNEKVEDSSEKEEVVALAKTNDVSLPVLEKVEDLTKDEAIIAQKETNDISAPVSEALSSSTAEAAQELTNKNASEVSNVDSVKVQKPSKVETKNSNTNTNIPSVPVGTQNEMSKNVVKAALKYIPYLVALLKTKEAYAYIKKDRLFDLPHTSYRDLTMLPQYDEVKMFTSLLCGIFNLDTPPEDELVDNYKQKLPNLVVANKYLGNILDDLYDCHEAQRNGTYKLNLSDLNFANRMLISAISNSEDDPSNLPSVSPEDVNTARKLFGKKIASNLSSRENDDADAKTMLHKITTNEVKASV